MKYALVTGGSRGIGRAVCVKLARMGYNVLINYANNEDEAAATLDAVRTEGSEGELLRFDVSNATQTSETLETWLRSHPDDEVEVLVNNAGIRRDNMMLFIAADEWQQVIDTSLGGFYNVTRHLLQSMLVRRYGRIINMASVSGLRGTAGQTNYSAAKGGLIAATKALALEVARNGVTVNAVAPGFIRTDMTAGLDCKAIAASIPARRLGNPEEVAELVGFLASHEAAYITGETISINGGLY
ncbi:MAG: 3-oxoacyl-ACP reductase FabG [Prevotella sp.]